MNYLAAFKSFVVASLMFALAFVLWACSDANQSVSSYTQEVRTNEPISIVFKDSVASGDIGVIYVHSKDDNVILLNGKGFEGLYAFRTDYELLLAPFGNGIESNPTQALAPKSDYTLTINLSKIPTSLQKETLTLKFKTKPAFAELISSEAQLEGGKLRIRYNVAFSESSLNKAVDSEKADSKLKSAMSLSNAKGEKLDFTLKSNNGAVSIISQELDSGLEDTYTLTLYAKELGLEKDIQFDFVKVKEKLELMRFEAISSPKPHIELVFSQELGNNPNLKDFIHLSPNLNTQITQQGNTIHINAPFNLSTPYQVSVREGIVSSDGSRLEASKDQEVIFQEIMPSLAFSQSGVFLPSSAEKKLSFKSINVKKVKVQISKIYPNNITHYLYNHNLIGSIRHSESKGSGYDFEDYYDDGRIYSQFYRLGDSVFEKEFDIKGEKNQWIQSQIDFSSMNEGRGAKGSDGIYVVTLSFDEKGVDYTFSPDVSEWRKNGFFRQGAISKHLIFSNIALIAQQGKDSQGRDSTEVLALDIASNTPMPQVEIAAIDIKNQVIAKATTAQDGTATLKQKNNEIFYLLASKGSDRAILKLNAPQSNEGFDVSGVMNVSNTNAYIYSDRGVYRPGDTAYINILARANNKPLEHPVLLSVTSPLQKVVEDLPLTSEGFGFYSYELKTPKNAPSGIWRLQLKVGDQSFWHNISVESVVPNRIKVELETPETISAASGELGFGISSNYLFGAPGADLDFEANLSVFDVPFYDKAYSAYSFSHPSSMRYSFSDKLEGKLDENGKAAVAFDLANSDKPNSNLKAFVSAKVFEQGGRGVEAREAIELVRFKSFVGIKAPARYVAPNQPIKLPIIVLSNDAHKPIAGKPLQYRIYQNSYSWWWDYDSYEGFTRSFKSDKNTKLIAEGRLTSGAKPIFLDFTPSSSGELFVEVQDMSEDFENSESHMSESGGHTSGVFLYVSEYGEPLDMPKVTQLGIKSDKESYVVGDEAVVSFESSADSKALVTLIKGDVVLKRFWSATNAGQTSITIPLGKEYAPNVYVAVMLLQNYKSLDNDRAQRLYGVLPLMVEDSQSKLHIDITAPESIRPGEDFSIKLSNKEGKKTAYTLAIVDEGLLDLTDFTSPNPWSHFYQKLALGLRVFDNYDLIIGRDIGKIHQILKIGGDELLLSKAKGRKDLSQAQRFKPVVFYSKPIMSDEGGNASFTYTMMPYMGSVKIMAVGANENALGSADKVMKVSAPVVMLPTIPRTLKNGDRFNLAIEVLPTQENVGKVKLKFTSGEKITLDKTSFSLDFSSKKSQNIVVGAQVSEDSIGVDFIDIALESGDFAMNDRTDIDILPFNPYTTLSKKLTLEPKGEMSVENPSAIIQGSQSGYIIASTKPLLSIDNRLKWLIRYPYGCIEQTTSSVLPQLFMSELSEADFIDKPSIVRNINAAIASMGRFQTADGGFSYWQGGIESDYYGSLYAGHFLLLAKQRGYYVSESMLKRWISYVKKSLNTPKPEAKLYPLYLLSLAGEAPIGILNDVLANDFKSLELSDKWLLAAAYELSGLEAQAHKIAQDLPTKATKRTQSYYDSTYGSLLRDQAVMLQAYIDVFKKPHDGMLNEITRVLESSEWLSTQTLGYALLPLASSQAQSVLDSEKSRIKLTLEGKSYEGERKLILPFSQARAKLSSQSDVKLYFNQVWDGILQEKDIKPKAQKIKLTREFVNSQGQSIDVSKLPQTSSFYLKLTLESAKEQVSVKNVAITQILPSGWEIENTRLTQNQAEPEFIQNATRAQYTDIKDDRISWFVDFYGTKQELYVKINAITPGGYMLPPATAEAMYDYSFNANTESKAVEVVNKR